MSEIRSISTGSYTIGQTSNLNFEAGTGIKITEPSEGTVRIANDETVLWENTGNKLTKDMTWPQTLTESVCNFQRVKFLFCGDSSVNKARWIEFEALNNNAYPLFDFRFDGGGNDNVFWRGAIFKLNGTSLTNEYNSTINLNSSFSGQGFNSNGYNYLVKVVGINRISGGSNE